MSKPAYKGVVKGRTVVLEKVADLPDGAEVLVTPLKAENGSPQAILAAMDAPPHVKPGDVDELMRLKASNQIRKSTDSKASAIAWRPTYSTQRSSAFW